MTKNKPTHHTRNVNRWKGLGKTSTFHRFTNPRRDKSFFFFFVFFFCLFFVMGYLFTIYTVYDLFHDHSL